MISVLQGFFIWFIGLFRPLTTRLEKWGDKLLLIATLCMQVLTCLSLDGRLLQGSSPAVYLTGCVLLAVMLLASVRQPLKKIAWDPLLSYLWLGTAALICVTSAIYDIQYLGVGLLLLLAYPCLALIWQSRGDIDRFWDVLSKAYVGLYAAVVVATLLFTSLATHSPIENRFAGFFSQPNMFAHYVSMPALFLLVFITKRAGEGAPVQKLLLPALLYGFAIAFSFLAMSRTMLLSNVCVLIAWAVFMVVRHKKELKKAVIPFVLLALGVLIAYLICMLMLDIVQPWVRGLFTAQAADLDYIRDRFSIDGKSLNSISADRIKIWKSYLPHLRLFGSPQTADELGLFNWTHNSFLKIAFVNGIVAGVAFAAVCIVAFIRAIQYALRNMHKSPYAVLPLLIVISCGVISNFECTVTPFTFFIEILYYFSMIPLFMRQKAKEA